MNRNNYILLGMAISYILIAIIQIRIDGLLPASLYVTVAFVSLEFTIMEMLKSTTKYLIHRLNKADEMNKENVELFKRSIKTYSQFAVLSEDAKEYEDAMTISIKDDISNINSKKVKKLIKLNSSVSCVQIIVCTIQIIITPLKAIPYDKMTTDVLNAMTLISFAMMFLSLFFSSIWDDYNSDLMEKRKVYKHTLTMHLDILDKIATENKEK